ncbi:MAG: carboxypeptidase regulatory-like domain-containing protein [Candidatus Aminicenantaceae bacterium]
MKKKFVMKTLIILSLFLLARIILNAQERANLFGLVSDSNKNPIPNASIKILSDEKQFDITVQSNSSGEFSVCGITPDIFSVEIKAKGFKSLVQKDILFEPSQTFFLKATLSPRAKTDKSTSELIRIDYTDNVVQTVINESQMNEYPSAHNVWSLIENQDLSATTNRIDVGGLWENIPALFSSRGSSSWTQNIYLLNGFDVTDPYYTGKPLLYPDFFSFEQTQLINAGNPPASYTPGAYFNLKSREGFDKNHSGMSAFYINHSLQSTNITPSLESEGLFESHTFNYLLEGNFYLSGPMIPDKLYYYTSLSNVQLSQNLAEYDKDNNSSIYSGLFGLKYKGSDSFFRLLWTGQIVTHSSYGAERDVPFSSTLNREDNYSVFQISWDKRVQNKHFFKAGICYAYGNIDSDFKERSKLQHGLEMFKNIPSGTAPMIVNDKRRLLTLLFKGESLTKNFLNAFNRFQYGIQLQYASSSSSKEIYDNIHLHFFESEPFEIVKYNTPVQHDESVFNINIYAQDSLTFSGMFSIYAGFHIISSHGWVPSRSADISSQMEPVDYSENGNKINWLNISPRFGISIPLSKNKTAAFKISAGRYYYTLPLNYLTYGNPGALGGTAYLWEDNNSDNQYQEGEESSVLRRTGPYYSTIDSDLKRPYTDEIVLSYIKTFGKHWYFSLSGFYRETRNLAETINIGLPITSYEPFTIFDLGDDRIPSHDDLEFTVYNQKVETLGNDFFLLSNPNPETRVSRYKGLDFVLLRKYGERFTFFFSFTATSAVGKTSPGNTEWENDDGVIGSLYDSPNTLINSKGRMRFDRAYTARLGFNYLAPFDIRISCIIKYYDGQPFARKIIVTGSNQGPFYIQANPRGLSRYEYNNTMDMRVEKIFNFTNSKLRIILDGFNILNSNLATEEGEWTNSKYPFRHATEIQSPRVLRLGIAFDF